VSAGSGLNPRKSSLAQLVAVPLDTVVSESTGCQRRPRTPSGISPVLANWSRKPWKRLRYSLKFVFFDRYSGTLRP
jgi:hypothetical protein